MVTKKQIDESMSIFGSALTDILKKIWIDPEIS